MCLPADGVQVVVLDEADKMLSLGFEPQLTRLRRRLCPPQSRAPPSYQRPQVRLLCISACRLIAPTCSDCSHCMQPSSICRLAVVSCDRATALSTHIPIAYLLLRHAKRCCVMYAGALVHGDNARQRRRAEQEVASPGGEVPCQRGDRCAGHQLHGRPGVR